MLKILEMALDFDYTSEYVLAIERREAAMTTIEKARTLWNARMAAIIEQDFRNGPKVDDAAFNFRHGWIVVDGQSFNGEMLFPNQHWPRFPADQGLSD